ncbi:hypothetical protein SAICODRAFT_6679 [Saitoella complicata NRRL Y-17804]|uniref:uncharacterized protein n=1 Tax=Saitoella complicata (strain BCRC 22490 / CBS 7301 / JCM 7358 / NBRC 10748 / NRRL Y-17804) TaxID=698492 RepID=UPI000867AC08|nr:uncharacterized protein SAICODRAFT_6679 [Saitoella complicata NRRL Y-17804]ODQ53898.1 hypothetical protein SAICODRAFT_6679 [Saitoella complicata NRRL Y-17804]
MQSLLRAHSHSHIASLFDIRIDSTERDVIVFRGPPGESAGVLLKGTVVLSLLETTSIRSITLKFYGRARVMWNETYITSSRAQSTRVQKQENTVYEHEWSFLPFGKHSHTIGKGNYEYPFEVVLPGDLPESIEGMEGGHIIYKMKAVVERGGFTAANLVKKKHIRVIRTLSPAALELSQTMLVENTWPNKIDYSISIPSKAVVIGSVIPINITLVPLIKGLNIGKISVTLKEYYTLNAAHGLHGLPASKSDVRTVQSMRIDELPTGQDQWEVNEAMILPKSLSQCTQDCDSDYIKVRHKLKFTVSLNNPDGHVSELRAALPVMLMISPRTHEDGTIPDEASGSYTDSNGFTHDENALPSYDLHMYDRLWDGISYTGVNTPMTSGFATPANRSRRSSIDLNDASGSGFGPGNSASQQMQLMAGLTALAERQARGISPRPINVHDAPSHYSVPATPLHPPEGMEGSQGPHDHSAPPGDYFSPRIGSSAAISDGARTPAVDMPEQSLEDLSKVPSYDSALRVNTLTLEPSTADLPTYEDSSRPPSRTGSQAEITPAVTPPRGLQRPPPTHTRSHISRTSSSLALRMLHGKRREH